MDASKPTYQIIGNYEIEYFGGDVTRVSTSVTELFSIPQKPLGLYELPPLVIVD